MEVQLDMFASSSEDYLYSQLESLKYSMDKRFRALFALMTEEQKEVMNIKNQLTHFLEGQNDNNTCSIHNGIL